MPFEESRYRELSRRAFLRKSAAIGLAAAIPSSLLAACGSDADVFAGSDTTAPTSTAANSTTSTSTTTTAATTTTPVDASLPEGAEVVVNFTYDADSSGAGVKNPYVAVWVEDEAGDLVATVALWFLQSQKGLKWLSDLRRWATIDGSDATIDAVSSATRVPGEYSVVWDGTTASGDRAEQGTYFIAIESAREHGPYSLIREPITLGDAPFSQMLSGEGELTDAAVALVLV